MVICIDFDGTIVEQNYPEIGKIKPFAKKIINTLYKEGHYIIIWTCRGGYSLILMRNWLIDNDILFHKINENLPFAKLGFKPQPKIYYDFLIDDRCLQGFPGWEEAYSIFKQRIPILIKENKELNKRT